MSDEVKAAQRILAGREHDCYLMSDARLLARACLSENDETAVDELWLATKAKIVGTAIGAVYVHAVSTTKRLMIHQDQMPDGKWAVELRTVGRQEDGCRISSYTHLATIATRGQLMRLMNALKESTESLKTSCTRTIQERQCTICGKIEQRSLNH